MRPPIDPAEVSAQVRAAVAGSQAAYSWLYRHYAPLVHAIHLGRVPRAQAEELTQDTFAIAFARLPQLREQARFGPWVAVIARRSWPPRSWIDAASESVDGVQDPAAGPETAADAERVLRAVRALPEAYREPLLLRLVEGMSGPEIAALTGLTPASVRVNLHRGMARLRAALGLAAVEQEQAHGHIV